MSGDVFISLSQDRISSIQQILSSNTDLYRGYEIAKEAIDDFYTWVFAETGVFGERDRYFWFEQASIINQKATGIAPPSEKNLASTFIIAHSAYGLKLDGSSAQLGDTSNAIAQAVLSDIIAQGGIPSLDSMLQDDIGVSLAAGQQSLGGWGGAFYYWDLAHNGSTVGEIISSNPQDYEKFILASAAATVAVALQEGKEVPTNGELQTVLGTAVGADLPLEIQAEIVGLAAQALGLCQLIVNADTFGPWTYDRINDNFYKLESDDSITIADGSEDGFLRERLNYRLAAETKGADQLSDLFDIYKSVGLFDCFLAGTAIALFHDPSKRIEEITCGDLVLSFDETGRMVPGRVTRTFQNIATTILDVHGLMVTPGHVTFCGEGRFAGRHVPIIDILRSDGALVTKDGEKLRAGTNLPVGSKGDQLIWAVTGERQADGTFRVREKGQIRLGTRYITHDGRDLSVMDLIDAAGGEVTEDGLISTGAVDAGAPFLWPFSEHLPTPEAYVLQRSQTTLPDIYAANEWEALRPQMPAPQPNAEPDAPTPLNAAKPH